MSTRPARTTARPRPRGWRGVALLMALALLGHSASYLHLLLVPHGVCEAHGDLTDLDAPAAASVPAPDGQASLVTPVAPESHDHHCFATAGRRESSRLAADAPGLPEGAAEDSPVLARLEPRHGTAILRFAPKHSPPVA